MGSSAMAQRPIVTNQPSYLLLAQDVRPLRCPLGGIIPVQSLTTVMRNAGEGIITDSWAMVDPIPTSAHLHPMPLTSARTERPLRFLVGRGSPAPSLKIARRSVGDRTLKGSWAMAEATPTKAHLFRFPAATPGIPALD